MKEKIIIEGKFDSVVRQIVRDIITIYKKGTTGEFGLPEDLNPELHAYEFPQFTNPLQVFLEIVEDESVEGFDVDADYYRDEDLIYVTLITNPRFGSKILYQLVGELNEVIAHEVEHIKQYESGYEFPKREPKKPEKYYSQQHELGAQKAGFKRRSKLEKSDYESVVRRWFDENKHKHNLNPQEAEKVIQKILAQK